MKRKPRRHPDSPSAGEPATRPESIEAYLDARGAGRAARHMLDQIAVDASTLDDLAKDREWIDEVRTAPAAPDQTHRILKRLGLDPAREGRDHLRFAMLSRRLVTAAVLVLAFVVGMWARSSVVSQSPGKTPDTVHRFERIIESLPLEIDPLERVRGMVLDVGSTLSEMDDTGRPAAETAPRESDQPRRPRRHQRREGIDRPGNEVEGLFTPEFDIESIQALWRDLGVV